jgi:hypothetical protein
MRVSLLFIAVTAATLLVPGPSQARQGPWCAGYDVGFSTWREDCSMPSFEACTQEVIAGNRGFCTPNPLWHGYIIEGGPRRGGKRKRYR